jgi:hypothetical protein
MGLSGWAQQRVKPAIDHAGSLLTGSVADYDRYVLRLAVAIRGLVYLWALTNAVRVLPGAWALLLPAAAHTVWAWRAAGGVRYPAVERVLGSDEVPPHRSSRRYATMDVAWALAMYVANLTIVMVAGRGWVPDFSDVAGFAWGVGAAGWIYMRPRLGTALLLAGATADVALAWLTADPAAASQMLYWRLVFPLYLLIVSVLRFARLAPLRVRDYQAIIDKLRDQLVAAGGGPEQATIAAEVQLHDLHNQLTSVLNDLPDHPSRAAVGIEAALEDLRRHARTRIDAEGTFPNNTSLFEQLLAAVRNARSQAAELCGNRHVRITEQLVASGLEQAELAHADGLPLLRSVIDEAVRNMHKHAGTSGTAHVTVGRRPRASDTLNLVFINRTSDGYPGTRPSNGQGIGLIDRAVSTLGGVVHQHGPNPDGSYVLNVSVPIKDRE